ncbi:MAG: hypothetical protein HKM24_05280, partial [Gammaproteobacteria bacterium]|nr:hypothetical protein [Gammaproteobacteria bacterium]
ITNPLDLSVMRQQFFSLGDDLLTDLNNDGATNPGDLSVMRQLYFQPPGPSALTGECL